MKRLRFLLGWVIVVLTIGCQGRIFTGTIVVNSEPQEASVYLDDSLTGKTTNCVFEDIEAGNHLIRLVLDEYLDWLDTVLVEADDTVLLDAELIPAGVVFIFSEPQGADVYLDDSSTGETTNCVLRSVTPGIYTVRLTLDGHLDWEQDIYSKGGGVDTVYAYLIEEATVLWRYETTRGFGITASPAIGTDGTIYFCSNDAYIYALDTDGTLCWEYPAGGGISCAVGADGTIYFGSYTYLYALNPDGTLKWRYDLERWVTSSPALACDGTIYVGTSSSENYLYAFNPDSTLKWRYQSNAQVNSSPAVDSDGSIYFGTDDGSIHAVDTSGELKWGYKTGGPVNSSPSIGSDGTIYCGSGNGYLYALTPEGTLRWQHYCRYAVKSSPAIAADGTIYVGSDANYIYAINPEGKLVWKYETMDIVRSSPTVASDGTIYCGCQDNHVYALHPDGRLRWRYQTDGQVESSPAIGEDGAIYIGSIDMNLYALKGSSHGLADSPWPKFRANNRNTGRVQ